MNHKWKTSSLSEVMRYNKWLLAAVVLLSLLCLMLGYACTSREEKRILIPCNDTDRRMEVSNQKLYPSYLQNWASYIARELFTTSPEDVEAQHAGIRKISDGSSELTKFFSNQLSFIQGNRASSVFFIKDANSIPGGARVNGTLHYWFGDSGEKISLEKSYLIFYKEGIRGLVLLTKIEEEIKDTEKTKGVK
ncbi:TraE/TraK family type IV conjugative transfer system protein [Rickettsiaceae bacterium]|nr:TraE/TraK family type IV conjugative transfer system protein [Rickettsiaceae bacterium]